jgi:hypothetical protein
LNSLLPPTTQPWICSYGAVIQIALTPSAPNQPSFSLAVRPAKSPPWKVPTSSAGFASRLRPYALLFAGLPSWKRSVMTK